jgi:hypothetical protein
VGNKTEAAQNMRDSKKVINTSKKGKLALDARHELKVIITS